MIQSLNLGGTLNANIDGKEIEVLQLDSVTIWEKVKDILYFNYTGVDESGNYEGSINYSGTPVSYAIGKPTFTVTETTAEDGSVTKNETITYANANGLKEEYFVEKYGSNYVKSWDSSATAPIQCVENVLVLPDNYNGMPVTRVLDKAFMARSVANSVETRYQPYFYTNIVFGNNITRLGALSFAGTGDNISLIELPARQFALYNTSFGDTKSYNSMLKINANISGNGVVLGGIGNNVPKLIVGRGVTSLSEPATTGGAVLVFEHLPEDTLTISWWMTTMKNAVTIDVYAEHDAPLYFDWSTHNITATFYHLDGTLWEKVSFTIAKAGEFETYTWTFSGNAEHYVLTKGNTTYIAYNNVPFNPLYEFRNEQITINYPTYTPITVTGYRTNFMKLEKEIGLTVPYSDPETNKADQGLNNYGIKTVYDAATKSITVKYASSLSGRVVSYGVTISNDSSNTLVLKLRDLSSQTISLTPYADKFVVGTKYEASGVIKLNNAPYFASDTNHATFTWE